MTRFEKFIPIIFKNEGVVSNVKEDSGGLTKYGISQKAYPNLDIINITKGQAEYIYKRDYYSPCKAELITDELLSLHVFDMAVNAGVGRAVKMLQSVAGVEADGIFGHKTLQAVNSKNLTQTYINARLNYYKSIAVGKNSIFLKGWINRVNNTKL